MSGNHDENHFMDADDEMVEYLTAKLEAEFDQKEASYEKVREGADKLLNLLVAGIGGAAMLFLGLRGQDIAAMAGLGVSMTGWFVCALYLLKNGITARERPSMFSRPNDLYFDDPATGRKVTLHDLRRLRIFDLGGSLDALAAIVRKRAVCLDSARYGAALVPVAGLGCALLGTFYFCR